MPNASVRAMILVVIPTAGSTGPLAASRNLIARFRGTGRFADRGPAVEPREGPVKPSVGMSLRGHLVLPVAEQLRSLKIPFVLASTHRSSDVGSEVFADAENIGKPSYKHHLLEALRRAVGKG